MWQELKRWVVEQVLWAEQHLKGKDGKEKRDAVIKRVAELVPFPWWLDWSKKWIIGRAVDLACEKLNWLTDWNFGQTQLNEKQAEEIAEVMEAPLPATQALTAATFDERLDALYKQYKVEEEKETEKPEAEAKTENLALPTAEDDAWNRSIAFSLKWEGGKNFKVVDNTVVLLNKADKGGPTAYGITQPTLDYARASGVVGHNEMTKLTQEEAKAIYKKNFWDRYSWGALAWPVCLCALDCSINHGGFAYILQRACNDLGAKLEVDGKYGPRTREALLASDPQKLAQAIVNQRKAYYDKIIAKDPGQEVHRKGWSNRLRSMAEAAGVTSPV